MLKAMKTALTGRRGESTRLLDDSDSDMGAGLSDGLSSSQLQDQVEGARVAGRRAAAQGTAIGSTRRQDALAGVQEMGVAGIELGLDAAVPGLGYGVSAASSVQSIRDARKQGDSMGAATAGEAVRTGAGFIPVIGQFVGFVDGALKVGVAALQSDKSRTAEKVQRAQGIVSESNAWLARLPEIRAEVRASGDKVQMDRLDKAEQRLRTSVAQAEAWVAKKSDRGSMPLLAGAGEDSDSAAAGEG